MPISNETRILRAELIHRWKPWEKSTGPKSEKGKAKVAQNGFRGNPRKTIQEARLLEKLIAEDVLVLASPSRDPSAIATE
jgi:hypothetical protein